MRVSVGRPQLTVLRSLDMPMERVRWPFVRPLVWFGVQFVATLAVLVLVTPTWVAWCCLVAMAYVVAGLPIAWRLYPQAQRSGWLGPVDLEDDWVSNRWTWSLILAIVPGPFIEVYRLAREVWRCLRMRG